MGELIIENEITKKDTNEKVTFSMLLKNKNFVKYFLANMISRFGDSIDLVAYGFMVYKLTGSAALLAALYAVNGIPSILVNLVSGVVVSYLPKKHVMWISDFCRGSVVLLTAILYYFNHLAIWHLFLFTILNSTFEAFRGPATTTLFANIVKEKHYEHATSFNSSATVFSELIGYAFAGIIIGYIGISGAIIIDSFTFYLCSVLIVSMNVLKEDLKHVALNLKTYFADLKEGIKIITDSKLIKTIGIFSGIFNIFVIPFNALEVAYVNDILKKGPVALSVIGVAFLSAMIISGLLIPKIKNSLSGHQMFVLSGIGISIGYLGFAFLGLFNGANIVYIFVIIFSVIMGFSLPLINVPIRVALMTKLDRSFLARVTALISVMSLSATPIGGAVVGGLVKFMSIPTLYILFSCILLILFLLQIKNKALQEL